MLYKVSVVEQLRRVVAVEAQSPSEAHQRVMDAWQNSEIVLSADDFEGVEVFVSETVRNVGDKEIIEGKDCIG